MASAGDIVLMLQLIKRTGSHFLELPEFAWEQIRERNSLSSACIAIRALIIIPCKFMCRT